MKKCFRSLLSWVLVLCMVLSLCVGAFAAPSATLIVTTPSGYTSASQVSYKTVDGYIANWGARGEDCGFLTTYAQNFYTGSYTYTSLSNLSGGTSTSSAPSSKLYTSLQTLMVNNHVTFTKYGSSSGLLCKNLYQYTDCTLGDPSYVSTLYRGLTVAGAWDGGASYNQEHIWPQSKCLGTASNSDIGDIMQLRAANPSENSSRGNTAYGESSGYYDPGVSVRGDCARTLLYMYVRWGNTENMWGTDGVIESLDILLEWIKEDPVDTWEMGHNDAVQSITGTRNVFVDYPEYAYLLFGRSIPSDLTTPSTGGNPNGGNSGSGSGGTVTPTGDTATLVTSTSSLKVGDQIIIAALDYDYALGTTQNTNNRSQADITKVDNTLYYGSNVQVLTLVSGNSSGTFGLEAGSGQYLAAASSSANNLKTKATLDDNSSWTVSIDASTGSATITAAGSYTRNTIRYNMGSDLFSCYNISNTQKDVAIYRVGTGDSGGGSSSGGTTTGSSATLVTKASALKAGDQIIIAALDYDYALGTTQNTNNRSQASVTKSGSTLTYGTDTQIITLETGAVSGAYAFSVGTSKYLYAPSSSSNHLKTTTEIAENASWTISIDSSTGAATISANGGVTRNLMRYNSSSSLFSCYAANNSQLDLAIYRIGSTTTSCTHTYTSKVTKAATCTTTGVRTYTCTKCGNSYTESIAATGHSYTSKVTAATCTAQGYTTYTCGSCGDSYKGSYTNSTGHSYTSKVTKAATCTASGVRTYTCSKCSNSYTETIAALGHSYSNGKCATCGAVDPNCSHSYTSTVTKAATCTASGVRTYTCSKCGNSYTESIAALGHSYTSSVTKAATCTASGVRTYSCSKCGNSYTEAIAALGHSYSNGKCTTCGTVDPNCTHSYTSTVTKAATCTTAGVRTYTCSKCGSSYTEGIAALGHSYTGQVTAPTCTTQGYTTFTCSTCKTSYKGDYTNTTGHSFSGGICINCGTTDASYVENYYLVGYINGADHGSEADWQNMGSYKFVNNKLTTTFTQDSYVFLKTEGNAKWLLTESYCTDTTGVFKEGGTEKMFVPGNVEVTFTIVKNADGSVTMSYTKNTAASTVPTLTLKAPTLEFKDMITVNAMFEATDTEDVEEMGMITYSSKVSTWDVRTAENVIPGTTYDASTGRYIASSQGIHAKYLGDTVYLAVYAKLNDGTYAYSKLAGYSPVQYATSKLSGSDTALKQLVVAMLNYGAAAQTHFGHNTGSLANSSLTAAQKALPATYSSDMVSTVGSVPTAKQGSFAGNTGFAKRYPSISFEGAFCINYFFTPSYAPDNGITLYYWNAADYNAASVLNTSNATGSIKMSGSAISEYQGDIIGIAAKALSEAVYVTAVYTQGGTTYTSGVLGYSIGSYCSSQATKGGTIADLAMATAVYGYQAKAYFG